MIRSLIVILFIFACYFSAASFASSKMIIEHDKQQAYHLFQDRKVQVYWDVLPTVFGYVSGGAGYAVADSLLAGVSGGGFFNCPGDIKLGYNFGLYFKYAFNHKVFKSGWGLNSFVLYSHISVREYYNNPYQMNGQSVLPYQKDWFDKDYQGFSAGVLLNYQWLWENGFMLDVGIGPAYYSVGSSWLDADRAGEGYFGLAAQFNLGFMF